MLRFTNSKINLGLSITGKLDNGYHTLNTVMWPIGWGDILEIVEAPEGKTTLTITGRKVDCPYDKNLVIKALRAIEGYIGEPLPPLSIYLRKIVPDGAGLGGGSGDASAMLSLINQFAGLNLSDDVLAQLAAAIGADCPFFIHNRPAIATGIGTELTPIEIPALEGKEIMVIKPQMTVSTAQAYAGVDKYLNSGQQHPNIADILHRPISEWRQLLVNDFERSVFAELPILAEIKQTLYDLGALYASMSGSGSALYGIFDHGDIPDKLPQSWDSYSRWTGLL